jgi:hypothetical protein
MEPLSQAGIRRCFVNCSQGEAKRLTLPGRLDDENWAELDFLAWVDPRATHNAYLVVPHGGEVVGLSLRSATPPKGRVRSGMCALCLTTHAAADIRLFSARKAGAAGKDGNTLGIYACGDLACCQYVRAQRKPSIPQPSESLTREERIDRLRTKVGTFVDQVLGG